MNHRLSQLFHSDKFRQFLRFGVIGCLSSALHYGIYYLLLFWTVANVAYIVGYLVSFIVNFLLTCSFTFRTKPTIKRFLGFAGSHAVNFGLHIILLNLLLFIGVHKLIAPVLVMSIAMLVQFTILRLIFKPHPTDFKEKDPTPHDRL